MAEDCLGDPELIILDEPANGLDPEGMREIRGIIKGLAERGKTIFLSSHLLWEVERTCNHVAIIQEGRIVRQASVEELVSSNVIAGLRSADLDTLKDVVSQYPGVVTTYIKDGMVVAELEDEDLAPLNEFVAQRGIYLSHLALQQRTLEDVFMELTGAADHDGMGAVA